MWHAWMSTSTKVDFLLSLFDTNQQLVERHPLRRCQPFDTAGGDGKDAKEQEPVVGGQGLLADL